MTAPHAKVKAALAVLKETILDIAADESVSSKICYKALLRTELLQRGVLTDENDNVVHILSDVQSAAGKALIDESSSSLPKPLLAGSAVIAGRIAEKLGQHYVAVRLEQTAVPPLLLEADSIKPVIARCRDVNDARFLALLELATTERSSEDVHSFIYSFYSVAEGYFLRAAHFQPDAPPMWKKAWDCLAEKQNLRENSSGSSYFDPTISWEAITVVTQLRRIAISKENTKRAAELSLVLADCYLDAITPVQSYNKVETRTLLQTFVADFRPIQPDLTPPQAAEKAAQTLQQVMDVSLLSGDDVVYHLAVQLRVQAALSETKIRASAESDYEWARNRTADGKAKNKSASEASTKVSMERCLQDARRKHFASVKVGSDLESCANALLENLIHESSTKYHGLGWKLLDQHVSWMQERAQVMATINANQQGWSDVASFVEPLLAGWQRRYPEASVENEREAVGNVKDLILASTIDEEICLMETVCCVVPCFEWMCFGSRSDLILPTELLTMTRNLLSVLETRRATERTKEKAQSKSVVAMDYGEDIMRLELECAHASVRALLALHCLADERGLIQLISYDATTRPTSADAYSAKFGFTFMEFLVCWSGFHKSPWSYCSQPEARTLVKRARACLDEAQFKWGRRITPVEQYILQLGEADMEGAAFTGGLVSDAQKNYTQILEATEVISDGVLADLMASRCYFGLAKLSLRERGTTSPHAEGDSEQASVSLARKSLMRLESIVLKKDDLSMYVWNSSNFIALAVRFQITASRQLIADAMLRSGDFMSAEAFLEAAVRDAPMDANAAFALGSFRLYSSFFGNELSSEIDKAAQIQLLRAAKLDSSKAGPFALLGYWYEHKKDLQRALGCYTKALFLDPSHPVAGRGVIRLVPVDSLKNVLDKAINNATAAIGWAWRAIGLQKALVDGEDELAVVSLLRALRCRDIEQPEADPLSAFYADPVQAELPGHGELSSSLADLAACYRRLGRFTAAIRSYHSAIHEAGPAVASPLLCSCAQVEMELGLFDEAVEKFSRAMDCSDDEMLRVATYGCGLARLSIAKRDLCDGKAGSAHELIQRGVQDCHKLHGRTNVCFQKLLGDLHSFAALLPADVFGEDGFCSSLENNEALLRTQLDFISKGKDAYQHAHSLVDIFGEVRDAISASLVTDIGSNLLMQAHLLSDWESKGLHQSSEEASKILSCAAAEFRRALELCPTYAPAWCGLGCAVINSDQLLAQHAFSRSLELDYRVPDAYANLSFLYTTYRRYSVSARVSDALTEIADTPMIWINRALILERTAAASPGEPQSRADILEASDAYRAALQVIKHPSAVVGLALTCRMTLADEHEPDSDAMIIESHSYASEYLGMHGRHDIPISMFDGILKMETALKNPTKHSKQLINEGRRQVLVGLDQLEGNQVLDDQNTALDQHVFRHVAEESNCCSVAGFAKESTTAEWSLDRRLVHQPNRGDLWVQLAKSLVARASTGASAKPALLAARRASSIMMQQLHTTLWMPTKKQSHFVKARDLSDALALQYWLKGVALSEEAKDAESSEFSSNLDLQRSLLIYPGNVLAREALKGVTS